MPDFDLLEHARQQHLVMLQVAIHHREIGRAARQHALDAGRTEPASAKALPATDTALRPRQLAHHVSRAVRRIVVDKDDFLDEAGERSVEALDHQRDLAAHVESRMITTSSTGATIAANVAASTNAAAGTFFRHSSPTLFGPCATGVTSDDQAGNLPIAQVVSQLKHSDLLAPLFVLNVGSRR
jgi:hypothetical protein